MGTYLQDNPTRRSQFRCPRRAQPSGVMVIHTAENAPDFVAFDGGAEAVANFIRTRSDPGSYHDLVDSDSGIQLVPYTCEAYQDGTGSNPHAWGGSVATRADVWPLAPKSWRDGAINQLAAAAARYARWVKANYGITVPAKRIRRAQSEQRVPGFISHAERDPARRTDPGRHFPWDQFLATYARLMGASQPKGDWFDMATQKDLAEVVKANSYQGPDLVTYHDWKSGDPVFLTDWMTKTPITHGSELHKTLQYFRQLQGQSKNATRIDRAVLDQIPTVKP